VNGAFVPRTLRDATPLRPGDVVLMFQAITGG
jgi:sulfur carrier protein ThiS